MENFNPIILELANSEKVLLLCVILSLRLIKEMVPIQEKMSISSYCRCKNQRWQKIEFCKIFDIKYWWGAFIYICLVKQYPCLSPSHPPSLCCSCLINDYTCFLCQLKLSFRLIKKCPSWLGMGRGLQRCRSCQTCGLAMIENCRYFLFLWLDITGFQCQDFCHMIFVWVNHSLIRMLLEILIFIIHWLTCVIVAIIY